jgi:hypothetical protein
MWKKKFQKGFENEIISKSISLLELPNKHILTFSSLGVEDLVLASSLPALSLVLRLKETLQHP